MFELYLVDLELRGKLIDTVNVIKKDYGYDRLPEQIRFKLYECIWAVEELQNKHLKVSTEAMDQ